MPLSIETVTEWETPWVLDTRNQRILGSAWSRYPPVAARLKLVVFDDDEHRLAGGAQHRDEIAERDVGAVVAVRVVDYVSAGFPERLAGPDRPRRLPFQLEQQFAFQHVTECRSAGVAVRGFSR